MKPQLKFAGLIFPIFGGAIAFAGETLDLTKLAEKVRPSVMLVMAESDSAAATGSGFFISSDGKFVTNHHVIEKATKITLKGENGAFYEVRGVLADDAVADIAILQVAAKNVQFLEIGASQTAQVGQHIAIIGSPMGLEGTLSEGIISAKRDLGEKGEWLQMTAGISPGSSGSPVLDASGK
jgi:S1-C subfamily serine protease